ncbi:iron chaperone [Brumimicrobium mesophilum]|uniref:iron chaperone n=1 Tax=Brumimicrobium mesophilum TaxID=392717 RepID=UPI000D13ECB4|nr:DUF1801 domain-containing protein [Brumimicrobium mesophilum]
MDKKNTFQSVDEYFNAQPKETKKMLLELKQCILKVNPEAEELFNYNIPSYTLVKGGKREQQIMFAGYNKHVGFYPHPTTIVEFKDKLSDYKTSKGTVQFSIDRPLPIELIIKMITYRMNVLRD